MAAQAPRQDKVAVLDFQNTSGKIEFDAFQKSIAEAVVTDLGKLGGVELVERGLLTKVVEEMQLSQTGLIDPETASKIGQAVGASVVILGSFTVVNHDLRINIRIVDVEKATILTAEWVKGSVGHVLELADKLSSVAWSKLTGQQIREKGKPVYQRWWFWMLVSGVGYTSAAALQKWPPFTAKAEEEPLPFPPAPPQR
jgi:TolB-like protein